MIKIIDEPNTNRLPPLDVKFLAGKRHLREDEIEILRKTNINDDDSWQNVYVDERGFDPNLFRGNEIRGFLVIGHLRKVDLRYHDLCLCAGVYCSNLENIVLGDDVCIREVKYFSNYHVDSRVILFCISEISCTCHSKFGNGILKEGEPESNRIWIGVGNENDARSILPFEDMITADAFLWSRYREDSKLMERFLEITEKPFSKKNDTFGFIGSNTVIKNTTLIKDAKIGENAYIKGAFKIKNVTILSSEDEPSQVGEGVELVNGIVGYRSRIFYQAVAVRFVIGRNCQLKYGARLLNSVLGDNSTVSCCEILNNLIFPFHEQHHNSSFLIASTVCGQSNIASGATVGSNHNSRSPDGELFAGRGFWPGLCSDFKHNCYFASFVLVAKGSYQNELNIRYPFSLVASNGARRAVSIIPSYWFLYNMYAIARNNMKFKKRDKRLIKVQNIETHPLAPDTIQEVVYGIERLIELTSQYLIERGYEKIIGALTEREKLQVAKDYLHQNPNADFKLQDMECQRKYGATILKPLKAYKEYRKIVKYFAVSVLMEYCKANSISSLSMQDMKEISELPLFTKWVNVGGQIIPEEKVYELFDKVKDGTIDSWQEIHSFYDECQKKYLDYKAAYSVHLLELLYSKKICEFSCCIFADIKNDVTLVSNEMYDSALDSRKKDYEDFFRKITFKSDDEMKCVLGTLADNEFLQDLKLKTEEFDSQLKSLFSGICGKLETPHN